MERINDAIFKKHIIENALFPSPDSDRFVAYIILTSKYPELTYWSWDGYSCDALADYSKGLVWRDSEVIDWQTRQIVATTVKSFWDCSTEEILATWMFLNGETTKTKRDWLSQIWRHQNV